MILTNYSTIYVWFFPGLPPAHTGASAGGIGSIGGGKGSLGGIAGIAGIGIDSGITGGLGSESLGGGGDMVQPMDVQSVGGLGIVDIGGEVRVSEGLN